MPHPSSSSTQDSFSTRAIHSGHSYKGQTGAVMPPVYLTSTFETGNTEGFDYTRSGNPNFRNLEESLSLLEPARFSTVFASGVSAITAVASTLKQGDTVLLEENVYGCTYRLFEQIFSHFGIQSQYVDFSNAKNFSLIEKIRPALVWIESPTNPLLKILDIRAIAQHCKQGTATLIVDNTFATAYFQNPLELGADLSLTSTTKYTSGHSDVLGGVVCTNAEAWNEKMRFAQKALGLHPSPFDCFLIARGLKTMALRMERHSANALALAEFLEKNTSVKRVLYPSLASHPQHALAQKQMRGGSGILTVDLGVSLEKTLAFLKKLRLFTQAESLGGVESLICHPATMTHASVPKEVRESIGITDSLIRFSVGIEAVEDLIKDVQQALER